MFNPSLYPYTSLGTKTGLLAALKNIKWGTILSNTQKTLGVINQTIPIVYQIKPIWNNAKTIFKIVGAIKDGDDTNKIETPVNNLNHDNNQLVKQLPTNTNYQNNQPNFFL